MHRHLAHLPSFTESPILFLTVTTSNRKAILNTNWADEILHSLWTNSAEKNGWFVGDYILMPDHLHCFARSGRDAEPLEKWVKMWKSVSAREMIRWHGLKAPIWQTDYFDRYLRSSESYSEKWKYVQMNPIRAGLVKDIDEWPYRGQIYKLSM